MILKTKLFSRVFACLLTFALGAAAFAAGNQAHDDTKTSLTGASVFVVANKKTQITQLTLNQLRAIFSLRVKQWPNGTPISVIVLPDANGTHREFLRDTLKMLPHQLRRQWDRYIYSGIGQGPTEVKNLKEMLNKIQSIPGAIGYSQSGVIDDQVITVTVR